MSVGSVRLDVRSLVLDWMQITVLSAIFGCHCELVSSCRAGPRGGSSKEHLWVSVDVPRYEKGKASSGVVPVFHSSYYLLLSDPVCESDARSF